MVVEIDRYLNGLIFIESSCDDYCYCKATVVDYNGGYPRRQWRLVSEVVGKMVGEEVSKEMKFLDGLCMAALDNPHNEKEKETVFDLHRSS